MEEDHPNGFRVRPFQPADTPGVRRVLEMTYGAQATAAEAYDWWSFGCPCASSGFMVAECDGSVVGVQPMEVFDYQDGQKSCKGGMLTGVAVHPDFRRRGIFSALVRACEKEAWRLGALFVTTMPNERSRPGFLKLGYTDLGRRSLLVRLIKPITTRSAIAPCLSHLAGVAAACLQSLKPISGGFGFSIKEVKTVDAELSTLCSRHETLYPGLRLSRSAEWWRWRFLEAPLRCYRVLEARDSSGELCGLGVYATGRRGKYQISYLVDLVISSQQALRAIANRLCEVAVADGSHAIGAVVGSVSLSNSLNQAGFWSIPPWFPIKRFYSVARFNPTCDVPPAWHRIDGWYQTFADWDNL